MVKYKLLFENQSIKAFRNDKQLKLFAYWSLAYCLILAIIFFLMLMSTVKNPTFLKKTRQRGLVRDHVTSSNENEIWTFDCYPRGEASQSACEARGCRWQPTQEPHVPWCYYPSNYNSYAVINRTATKYGLTVELNATRQSPYPNDVQRLQASFKYESQYRLHIKITDATGSRFEPPYPDIPLLSKLSVDNDYVLEVDEKYFGFAIKRKSTETLIFDARNMGGFTYSDQFLQFSALLQNKYMYGLGERRSNFALQADWQTIALFNHDSPPKNGVNLYGTHPFYMGIEHDGMAHGVFLLNSNAMDIVLQPGPAITYRPIGGIFDFYFFMGPTPEDVIRQYTEVIGTTFLPPYWALGFHLSRFGLRTLNDTINFWNRNRNSGIPFDTQWNDIDYMDDRNDFTVGKSYEGLGQFVDHLHDVGMRYVAIIDPGVSSKEEPGTYPPYDNGLKSDIFIKNVSGLPLEGKVWNTKGGTVFPDFTNPKVVLYWLKLLNDTYEKQFKFDGIWIDMNEISNMIDGSWNGCNGTNKYDDPPYVPQVDGGHLNYKTVCMNSEHYAGVHYDVHNLYGLAESIVTSFCVSTVTKKRSFVLTRATFSGSGHYVAHWTGDVYSTWNELRQSVIDILNFNLFGISMVGADICGFNDNTTYELCVRWMQLGAFYPFSRNHNSDDCVDQDPAFFGEVFVNATKKALTMRYQLLPYLYTLLWNSNRNGDTVVRPLFFEFPDEPVTYAIETQFLWGSNLLVIPVLDEGQQQVTGYFPSGYWYDAYTLEWLQSSGLEVTISAPMDTIPLYFKGGSVIPFQEPSQTTAASRKNAFGLYVAYDSNLYASGNLYWDDGESFDTYGNGEYNFIEFNLINSTTLAGIPVFWGYNTTMVLNSINFMGVDGIVKDVFVNGLNHTNFQFIEDIKVLKIISANIDLSEAFFVRLCT